MTKLASRLGRNFVSFWQTMIIRILLLVLLSVPAWGRDSSGLLDLIQTTSPSNRMTLALVPLVNATGEPALEHWRYGSQMVIGGPLANVKSMRILPQVSIRYGFAQLHKKPGDLLNAEEAAHLGELLEARRLLWGSYIRTESKWVVAVRVLNVSNGACS